jgi:hypothetical protein
LRIVEQVEPPGEDAREDAHQDEHGERERDPRTGRGASRPATHRRIFALTADALASVIPYGLGRQRGRSRNPNA